MTWGHILTPVSVAANEPEGADEATVRARAVDLKRLGEVHGVRRLRFASPGRLVGHMDDDRDALDAMAFEAAATELLGAPVGLFSDGVLGKANVSVDLVYARAL